MSRKTATTTVYLRGGTRQVKMEDASVFGAVNSEKDTSGTHIHDTQKDTQRQTHTERHTQIHT